MNCASRLCLRVRQSMGAIVPVALRWACPPVHPSTHRLGPLRGRLGPQPQTCRAERPACLVGLAFAAGPLRASFGRLGVGLPACGARPPASRGLPPGGQAGRPAATLAGTPALSSVGRPHLRSALTADASQPLRFAAWPGRVGVRLAALPPRCCRCVSVSTRPRLGGACKAGGRAPWALADRAPPPLGVGRWGALKPTTLRCRFSPGGSPVRSRPFGCVFGGGVETFASLTSTCPAHVLAVTPFGRSATTARLPSGRRFALPQGHRTCVAYNVFIGFSKKREPGVGTGHIFGGSSGAKRPQSGHFAVRNSTLICEDAGRPPNR